MSQAQAKPVVQFLERLQQTGGLKGTDLANFAGVSKATVSRWASGQKAPHPKTQLIMSDLAYVVMRLGEYYSTEEVRAWLYARHPQLGGARAIDLIHDARSAAVVAILDRLDAAAYLLPWRAAKASAGPPPEPTMRVAGNSEAVGCA